MTQRGPIRLLAITPPAALLPSLDPDLVDAWLDAGAGAHGLALLLREPGASLETTLGDPRFGPLRRRLAARSIPTLVSVDPRQVQPEDAKGWLERSAPRVAGVQLRGDPSLALCRRWRDVLGPDARIGRSVHGAAPDLGKAPDLGPGIVDYSCLAPIYPPRTRLPGDAKLAIGLDGLRAWASSTPDLLALGGVEPSNAGACLAAGAQGIAGIRLFFGALAEARQDVEVLCQVLAEHRDHVRPQTHPRG